MIALPESSPIFARAIAESHIIFGCSWLSIFFNNGIELEVKIRYNSEPQPAIVNLLEGNYAEINFSKPQRSITPGQAVVFYQDEILIGGGFIELSYDKNNESVLGRSKADVNQVIGWFVLSPPRFLNFFCALEV